MSYFITGSNLQTKYVNTSGISAIDVRPDVQGRPVVIASIEVTEVGGGTPNLTIDIYDPVATISYFKRNAEAMTAKQTVVYAEPFWLPQFWQLRITLSAGTASVLINYFAPDASGRS